jgi:hypothetical protein
MGSVQVVLKLQPGVVIASRALPLILAVGQLMRTSVQPRLSRLAIFECLNIGQLPDGVCPDVKRAIGQQSLRGNGQVVVCLEACKQLSLREQGFILPLFVQQRYVLVWLWESSANDSTLSPLLDDDLSEMEEAHADVVRRR